MINIVVIKPYDGIEKVIKEAFEEHPLRNSLSYEIIDTLAPLALEKAQPFNYVFSPQTDVVIARYFSAQHIRNQKITCIEIALTGYDVVIAINECIKLYNPKKIAVFTPKDTLYEASNLIEIYKQQEIILMEITDLDTLQEQLNQAKANGVDAVVGGLIVVESARKLGMQGVLTRLSKMNITKAINDAIQIVEITRKKNEENKRLRGIMDYSFGGIISTDSDGNIILINRHAQEFFGYDVQKAGPKTIWDLLPDLSRDAIKNGDVIEDELMKIKGTLITFNMVPISGKNGNSGVVITFQKVTAIQKLEGKIRNKIHEKGFYARYRFSDIITKSPTMLECIERARRFSKVNSNVLLIGETGTGKEMFAQSIHNESQRRDGPFVAINCAALPEALLESELFGYVDGAFTGAAKGGKAGLFEIAHNGTIFLDEIQDISAKLQGRLLRVIEEREIIRLGHDRVTSIDVRIISASNQDLWRKVERGEFRSDLLYRLDVLQLEIPPLAQRDQDVLLLAEYFIANHDFGFKSTVKEISPEGKLLLMEYTWPGNIRELRNFCERLCVTCDKPIADAKDVKRALYGGNIIPINLSEKPKQAGPSVTMKEMEKKIILDTLVLCGGSKKMAARELGWSKSTLWRKMKEHGIS
ncbi:MAG TPA: sigma 54-interacting transcriptional regulator [Peptococcaceae bacterium]|nr:sigma 54-interacting transcriptional regulator [Peptococcaceae bacterium]